MTRKAPKRKIVVRPLETHSYAILFFLDRRRKGLFPRSIHHKGIETSNGNVDCRQEATDVFFFFSRQERRIFLS